MQSSDIHKTPPLAASGAVVSYRGARAVDGVSLAINTGEIYALVGPNGAGKSSFVKGVCGRARLSGGSVTVGGAPAGSAAARRQIGVAPQRPALFDRLSALENVEAFAALAGVAATERGERAREALSFAGLDPDARTHAQRLSGGQRQRANIAAAVVHAPGLVILDEPAAALDRQGVDDVDALIVRLAARGVAILIVTHDMTQAERLATRAGVMKSGRLIAEGSPADLKLRHAGGGLQVSICAAPGAAVILAEAGFASAGVQRWRGRLPDHEAVAMLANRLAAAGAPAREVEAAAPTLGDAVAAILAGEGRPT